MNCHYWMLQTCRIMIVWGLKSRIDQNTSGRGEVPKITIQMKNLYHQLFSISEYELPSPDAPECVMTVWGIESRIDQNTSGRGEVPKFTVQM